MYWAWAERAVSRSAPPRWLVPILLAWLAACSGDVRSPETQIRRLIGDLAEAVEQGSIGQAAAWLDTDYRDQFHPDKRSAVSTLFGHMRRHRKIHLFVRINDLQVIEPQGQARAVVQVAMTGKPVDSVESLIALKADLYRFEVRFTRNREQGAWQIASSRWKRADLASLLP